MKCINVMYLSAGLEGPGSQSEEQLSTNLHITIQHAQGAAVVHYVMIYKQQKHLVIPQRMSQGGSMSPSGFISFYLMCYTFAISTVKLMPSLMLCHDNEVPLVALNLQSPNK